MVVVDSPHNTPAQSAAVLLGRKRTHDYVVDVIWNDGAFGSTLCCFTGRRRRGWSVSPSNSSLAIVHPAACTTVLQIALPT